MEQRTADELARHNQRQMLEAFLRVVPGEDAASIGTVRPSFEARGGPRPVPWAHFEADTDARLSLFPAHLLRHWARALRLLTWHHQQVLYLHLVLDQSQVDVAVLLRRSPRWVRLTKAQALTTLAELLWTARWRPKTPRAHRKARLQEGVPAVGPARVNGVLATEVGS